MDKTIEYYNQNADMFAQDCAYPHKKYNNKN